MATGPHRRPDAQLRALFAELRLAGFHILTYRKGPPQVGGGPGGATGARSAASNTEATSSA